MQHGVSDPLLGPPYSERAFLPVKPNVSARNLKEAGKRNQCAYLCNTCCEGLVFYVNGKWEVWRMCDVMIGVISSSVGLPVHGTSVSLCPPMLE